MNKKRKAIIAANEISKLKTYTLGGYPQKILIEGKKRSYPIVVYLHGGPGSPFPYNAGCRGLFPELTDQVIMVYWDQLGCGINNYVIDNTFTIDSYVDMTIDLIKQLKEEYPDNTINIYGVSWGSILAAKVAEAVPELLHRVFVYGQVLKKISFNDEVYEALEKSDLPGKYKDILANIKKSSEHTVKDARTLSRWINKYTEGYYTKSGEKPPIGPIIRGLLFSPDYTFKDFKAMIINGYVKNESLIKELINLDLSETLKNISIPYLILQGTTDIVTSTKTISEYLDTINNSNLHFKLIENSGHIPCAKGIDEIFKQGFAFIRE
jgi:pimeloyl-ACP methyl ester carboxylesterase